MHLPALQSDQHMFSLLGLHRPLVMAQQLGLDVNLTGGLSPIQTIYTKLITQLASPVSAILTEPVITFPLLLEQSTEKNHGLVICLDAMPVGVDHQRLPQLLSNWGVEEIANNYGVAYLHLDYHPAEAMALEKKKIVAEIHDSCRRMGIDLVLDLEVYLQPDQPSQPTSFQETQLQAIQELRTSAELLILQYPHDALAAATITAQLDTPWIVGLANDSYEAMKQDLRTSLENGAQGFLVGDALWREIEGMRRADVSPDLTAIQQFIGATARDRIIELVRITNEFGKA